MMSGFNCTCCTILELSSVFEDKTVKYFNIYDALTQSTRYHLG